MGKVLKVKLNFSPCPQANLSNIRYSYSQSLISLFMACYRRGHLQGVAAICLSLVRKTGCMAQHGYKGKVCKSVSIHLRGYPLRYKRKACIPMLYSYTCADRPFFFPLAQIAATPCK